VAEVACEAVPRGRRAARKLATHDRLIRSGVELFVAQGYTRTTVEEIARAVGVSERTFFRYFRAKDDIIVGFCRYGLDLLIEAFDELPNDRPLVERVREAFRAVLDDARAELPAVRLLADLLRSSPVLRARWLEEQQRFEDLLAARIEADRAGRPDRDLEGRVVAAALGAVVRAALQVWAERGMGDDLSDIVADAFSLLDAGVLGQMSMRPVRPTSGPAQPAPGHRRARHGAGRVGLGSLAAGGGVPSAPAVGAPGRPTDPATT